ncbi:MAG: Fic family protein [Prevotella sp.]|nr:Fic family protein [Candidatus Prevotella equi]
MKESKQQYLDFDEYIRQGEPEQQEKAANWNIAIGLQAVDGLKPSQYLIDTAKRNIEGEISLDETQELIHNYYISKQNRETPNDDTEEADKVSTNISRLLASKALNFTYFGYTQVHRQIFDGVYKFAGKVRDYEISKREWVLRGDTVSYGYAFELKQAIEYDLEQERQFNYGSLSRDEIITHIAHFVAYLWQIHAFPEGNTRTTAVFIIQYLRSLGFKVDNEMFKNHSWYFRNALVRYVYKNNEGVMYEPKYLERFFRNLLFGEQWVLKNRYLIINPPAEYAEQPRLDTPTTRRQQETLAQARSTAQAEHSNRTSTEQVPNKFACGNENIIILMRAIGSEQVSIKQMMERLGLKHRPNFMEMYLNPTIAEGYVRMLYPDSPRHPRQRYLLTVKGLMVYSEINKEDKQ